MEDLELMRNVTIGQYIPTGSIIHRLDPRTKLLGLGLLILAIILCRGMTVLIPSLILIIGLVLLSRVPLGFAGGGLKSTMPVLLFIGVLQLLFGWGSTSTSDCVVLWSYWIINISSCSIMSIVSMLLRLSCLIYLISLLTLTSTISELSHGIDSLLRPFQKIGLPAHELAMIMTIAIRFVPTLAEELEKLLKAQAARGSDIRMGKNPVQRTMHLLPVLVPLFLTTLRRAELLAEAMTARGYNGGTGRSNYIELQYQRTDVIALILFVVVCIGILFIPFPVVDRALTSLLIHAAGQ